MPARLLVREPDGSVAEHHGSELSELRDRCTWLDITDPKPADLDLVAEELNLHPLAVEDTIHRHQRPKIDEYPDHYFVVFYALEEPQPDAVRDIEVSIFLAKNVVVTVHQGPVAAIAAVEKRYREGRLESAGRLLHALLDTMVDGYFEVVDGFGDRVELLESLILEERAVSHQTSLNELFHLKRDLLRIRQRIAPEREVLAVLARGDVRELREPGGRAYFQDVYDHIVRVTDEIDTFRDLTSNVIDAHLAAASNRLNEVVKVLTSAATVLLVLSVITSFFGMNFEALPYESVGFFWATMAGMLLVGLLLLMYFRRKGYL